MRRLVTPSRKSANRSRAWLRSFPSQVQIVALLVALLVAVGLALTAAPAVAGQSLAGPRIAEIDKGGFGDSGNNYAWSMAWFKDKLYVGTARLQRCVENATLDFYYPGQGYYVEHPEPEMTCPADKWDMDLRAEIWQFTPKSNSWLRVYRSPTVPNPRAPGRLIAQDLGYRGMTVYQGALYVGGVSADEMVPELAETSPPRVLRSTDGTHFDALNASPGTLSTAFGPQPAIGFRAMASVRGRLFVTATGGLTGDGVLMEVSGAGGTTPKFTQVSPATLQIFEIQPFRNRLYIGTGNNKTGYGLYASELTPGDPQWKPVITDGAGRGTAVNSVVSMSVYQDKLYVGASGWYSTLFPASELVRVNSDDSWSLVVGNPRAVAGLGLKWPISGLPDGYGNPFNAHFWRAAVNRKALVVGTNDWSYALRSIPFLTDLLAPYYGFDMWGTCDGTYWWQGTQNAFGNGRYNFGMRTAVSTPQGLFIGSTNTIQGSSVWRAPHLPACPAGTWTSGAVPTHTSPSSVPQGSTSAMAVAPTRLITDATRCGTSVSWDDAPGATRYVVQRAGYRSHRVVAAHPPPRLPNGYSAEVPPIVDSRSLATAVSISVPGSFATLGRSEGASFVDKTAKPGQRYLYRVVAVSSKGDVSSPSNVASDPSLQPKASVTSARRLRAAPHLTTAAKETLADQNLRLSRGAALSTKGCS